MSTAASASPTELSPNTSAGAPSGPRAAMYRFALAYGNLSQARLAARDRQLSALSSPGLARSFQPGSGAAQRLVARGLPGGATMVARVISIHTEPPRGNRDRGTVILEQRLQRQGGSSEQPFDGTFAVEAVRVGTVWKIASFTGQG